MFKHSLYNYYKDCFYNYYKDCCLRAEFSNQIQSDRAMAKGKHEIAVTVNKVSRLVVAQGFRMQKSTLSRRLLMQKRYVLLNLKVRTKYVLVG